MMQIASVSLFSYWKDSVYPPCAAAAWSGMHKDNAIAIIIPSFNEYINSKFHFCMAFTRF